jgi:hypothetical protein
MMKRLAVALAVTSIVSIGAAIEWNMTEADRPEVPEALAVTQGAAGDTVTNSDDWIWE